LDDLEGSYLGLYRVEMGNDTMLFWERKGGN
jgi:hypothetical protein